MLIRTQFIIVEKVNEYIFFNVLKRIFEKMEAAPQIF